MYTIYRILILISISKLDTGYAWPSRTVLSGSATEKDVTSLAAITSRQALPVILQGLQAHEELLFPQELTKAQIKYGRLVSGTEFFAHPAEEEHPQIFFCPSLDAQENCLVPKIFEASQVLECEIEPLTVIERSSNKKKCGSEEKGIVMNFMFNLCPGIQPYKMKGFETYSFCYDESSSKTLFVGYTLYSPKLTREKLLSREREIQFQLNAEFIAINSMLYLEAAIKYESQYALQKLVPTEDFPFTTWKRTTYHVANVALQHKKLIYLWNKINDFIRSHAILKITEFRAPTYRNVLIGVFDIPKDEIHSAKSNDQMGNIWVKIVYTMSSENRCVAILMNNFIIESTAESENDEQYIDKFCGSNFCTSSLKEMFDKVGGQVRCCEVNEAILNLFSLRIRCYSLLQIINVNI